MPEPDRRPETRLGSPWAHGLPRLDAAAAWWCEHDTVLYAVWALACTVYAATTFYSYMLVQTRGVWSAPLDDVFIHFDYARSLARGYLFHWSEGNGYSSGNTSLSYPVVLAVGYWLGFRKLSIVLWSALVAGAAVFSFLLCAGAMLTRPQPTKRAAAGWCGRWIRFMLPPAVLSMGVLDWTLWSGMENALHLAAWGVCLLLCLRLAGADCCKAAVRRAWMLGIAGAILVATRPESGVCVAAFGGFAVWVGHRRKWLRGVGSVAQTLVAVGGPGVLALAAQAGANRLLTGEWEANGAIAKLFVNNPYMSTADMWHRYQSLIGYIVPRLTEHHLSDAHWVGRLLPALGLLPLASRRLRPAAALLWAQTIGWLLIVGLNNQLRWQNERYAMPAVAWLMLLAALGVGVLALRTGARLGRRRSLAQGLRGALAIAVVATYWIHQAPRMKDQVWFFGRACRNILDQHVTAGMALRKMGVRRLLVGDAGALVYAADRPGLDLIGLGGYHALPFARSGVHGLGASLELLERMPPGERPDFMALYPSWWADLPIYFGRYLISVPVYGNVICGGADKVLYRAHWESFDRGGAPRSRRGGERLVDELDVADLISERAHGYALPGPGIGYVRYRVLADPHDLSRDLFDAGRIVPPHHPEGARLTGPGNGGRLIVRVAPSQPLRSLVRVDGEVVGTLTAEPAVGAWREVSVPLPNSSGTTVRIELIPQQGSTVHYHWWVVETAP